MPISEIRSGFQEPGGFGSFELQKGLPDRIHIQPQAEAGAAGELRPEFGSLLRVRQEALQPSFMDIVTGFVDDVNTHQARAGRAVKSFVAGEITDLHQVTVALQEAGIAMDLLIEIRNRTMEAFQEVMRMQV